jgi:predicted nucleotidyltransferase
MTEDLQDPEDKAVPAAPATEIEDRDLESMIALMIPVLKEHGVTKAGVYGSRVRGDNKDDSDLDVVVELPDKASLLDLVGLELELKDLLGIKVDVSTYNGLHPRLRDRILSEERRIL